LGRIGEVLNRPRIMGARKIALVQESFEKIET
jgi:hypothetical protein